MTGLLFLAVAADAVAVAVHGVVGHRWLADQLRDVQLRESALFGDADVARRVLAVTWHVVTAMLTVSGVTLLLMTVGAIGRGSELLRFIAALHAAALLVGAVYLLRRLDALLRPVPPIFVTCMTTVVVTTFIAS